MAPSWAVSDGTTGKGKRMIGDFDKDAIVAEKRRDALTRS